MKLKTHAVLVVIAPGLHLDHRGEIARKDIGILEEI